MHELSEKNVNSDILKIKEKHLEIKETNKMGLGLFAKKDIPKGNFIFRIKGEIKKRNYKNRQEASAEPNMLGIGKNVWIDPVGAARCINHSCKPNSGIRGRITFVAINDIKKGEEITFDYSTTEESEWEMFCNCGHDNCRGIIKSITHLPQENFKELFSYIPKYFKNIYIKKQKNE